MAQLDPHSLFSIFEKGDEEVYKEHGMESLLDNPYVLISMVVKGLENYNIMDIMYQRQYPKQYKANRRVIQLKYFNRLFSYLTRIDVKQFDPKYSIGDSYDIQHVCATLDGLMFYYEAIEQYEKCHTIKSITDLLKENKQPVSNLI